MPTRIPRREFLRFSAMAAAAATVAACAPAASPTAAPAPAGQATPAPQPAPTKPAAAAPTAAPTAPPTVVFQTTQVTPTPAPAAPAAAAATATPAAAAPKYREAPMLADLVKSGKLPPVEQRLPQNPRVLKPQEEVGQYSTVWRRAYKGVSDRNGPTKLLEEMLIEWDAPTASKIGVIANTVEKWEQSADATEFTFYLRKGLRWSDGVEVTTDDVKFWWEDVQFNKDIMAVPCYLIHQKVGKDYKDATLTIVDKYTWKVKYAAPFPLLPIRISTIGSGTDTGNPGYILPSHYLKKFLPKYASVDELNKLAADKKLPNWPALWGVAGNMQGPIVWWMLNPDLPVIYPWKIKNPPPADPMVMERNPFYFQVDPEGQQLPYFDRIEHAFFDSQEVLNLWVASGKIDMQMRHMSTGSYTFYKENEKKGNYRTFRWRYAATDTYFINAHCPDKELAKLLLMPDFRQALSIGINRKEVLEMVWNGLGRAMQASPVQGSPSYDPEFSAKWAEYDPKKANDLLDKLGLKKGSDGFRVRADGKPLEVTVEHINTTGMPENDMNELVRKYWAAIGVKGTMKFVERSLYEEHGNNLEQELNFWQADRNAIPMAEPDRYLQGMFGAYFRWYVGDPRKKEEPPADHPIRKIWDLWEKCQVEPDETKRNALFMQIIAWHKEAPQWIGVVGEKVQPMIVASNFRNVLDGYIFDNTLRDSGLQNPQQFYIKK